ncbi:MAG: hypothetical protein ACR2NZ_18845 [Rubripirellula sp.]
MPDLLKDAPMDGRTHRRIIVIILMSLVLFFGSGAWCVHQIVAWAKDLPNRIQIEVDSQALGDFMAEAMRVSLREGETQQQIEGLRLIRDGLRTDASFVPYVQQQLAEEILPLQESDSSQVAALASEISELAGLFAPTDGDVDLD